MTAKGTTGTHYKTAENRKSGQILVRLYPDELDKVRARAAKKGVSMSQYAHDAIMRTVYPKRYPLSDVERAKGGRRRSTPSRKTNTQ